MQSNTNMPPMNMHNNMNGMNSNMMIDNFKSMVLTMAMVKGTNGSNNDTTSMMNTLIMMLVISFIDTIVIYIKKILIKFKIMIKKILYITRLDPLNYKSWSGTTFFIYKALKNNFNVTTVGPLSNRIRYLFIAKKYL